MPQPLYTPGKDPVPIVQEAGWAPGLVWTGVEILAPTGIRSLDHPAHSQSLYRLRYLAHLSLAVGSTNWHFVLPEDGTLVPKHDRDTPFIFIYSRYFAFGW